MTENSREVRSLNISRLTEWLCVRCQYFLVALMNMNLNTVFKEITHDKYNDNNNNNDTKKHTFLNSSQIEN